MQTRNRRHPGHIERRNGAYCLRLSVGGKRHALTIPATTYKEACEWAKKTYSDLRAQHFRIKKEQLQVKTVDMLLTEYEHISLPQLKPGAIRSYKDSINPVRTYFTKHSAIKAVHEVAEKNVEDYLAWRRLSRLNREGKPLSNRTLQKDRTVLHTIFKFAKRRKYCSSNPVTETDRPKADTFDPIILTDAEYNQLLAQCAHSPMLLLYVAVLGETGLRCNSEALRLQWSDVRFDMHDYGCIKVVSGRDGHTTKSGRSRFVPITQRLLPVLKHHFEKYQYAEYNGKSSPYVFHHLNSHAKYTAGERIKSLYGGFKDAAERAKLPPALRQHDLRHFRTTTWLAAGHSPVAVQQAMGHSDIKTTMGYYKFLPEHLRGLASNFTNSEQIHHSSNITN